MGWRVASLRFDRRGERVDQRACHGPVEPSDPAPGPKFTFRLTRIETAATREGLAALALIRVQEIEGFVHGLFGRQEEIDLPERAHRALDDLGKMRAMFAAVRDFVNDEAKAAPLKEMETTLRHMREMTKNAEHAMHTVLLSCKRARRQMLAGMPASKPTMH